MRDLTTLLRLYIDQRFCGREAQLAKALLINRSTVHRIVAGIKPLSLGAIDAWSDALGLDGRARQEFRFAVELSHAPVSIARRFKALERSLRWSKMRCANSRS